MVWAALAILDLRLTHADGFDQDAIITGCVQQQQRSGARFGQTAHPAAGGHGADEHPRVTAVFRHPHPIPQQRAAAERAGRVHGQDRDRQADLAVAGGQRRHERRFARARRAGYADQMRLACVRKSRLHDPGGVDRPVLHAADGARKGKPVSPQEAVDQLLGGSLFGHWQFEASENGPERDREAFPFSPYSPSRARIKAMISAEDVPGPKTAWTPAALSRSASSSGMMPPTSTSASSWPWA